MSMSIDSFFLNLVYMQGRIMTLYDHKTNEIMGAL
jgi:hypothetical protein